VYLSTPRPLGFPVLEDQQCAGALMWSCVTLVYLVPAAILTVRLLGVRNSQPTQFIEPPSLATPPHQKQPS
jgi:hypothetical protein